MASFDKVTKISAGPKVHEPTKVFRARIFDNLQSTPKRIFQISDDEGTEMTYEELKSYSIRVAMNLRRLDIKEGDVISVLLKNSTYVAPIIIGCMLNGSIFNPLTHQIRFDSNWFGMHLSAVHPKLVIMEQFAENYQDMLSLVEEMKINCRIFLLNHHDENLTDVKSELLEKHQKWNDEDEERYFIENILQTSHNKIDNNSILALIPSSGTTGKPKLIQWNGKHAYGAGSFWRFHENIVGFSFSTISWLTGIAMLIYPLLHNGTRIVTKENFSLEGFSSLVKKYRITHTFVSSEGARTMLRMSDNVNPKNFMSVRDCLCGGERLSKNVREYMRSIFRENIFNIAYGATEVGVVTELDGYCDTSQFIDNIVGQPKFNIEVKIADISTGIVRDVKQCGEILVRNGNFIGYYGDEKLTKESLSEKEWYKTGDVGYLDEIGRLFVLGRKNQMLKIPGQLEMIHSSIIENVIENFDGISLTCAVNLSNNSIAILCETFQNCEKSIEDFKQLANEAFNNLNFKFEYEFFVVENIPRTNPNSRKIHRANAQELAEKISSLSKKLYS